MISKLQKQVRPAFALAFALAVALGATNVMAETIKKLHTSPLLVINLPTSNTTRYGLIVSSNGTSSTIDLSNGDLDKLSVAVQLSSYTGTAPSLALQVSPDGTNWFTNGSFTVNLETAAASALTTYYANVNVSPGLKARLTTTLTAGTTLYSYKVWATASVD